MLKPLTVWITTNCGKFLEMEIPGHLTCLLRNLYAGQEAAVRTWRVTTGWFKIGKGVRRGWILSPRLFNFYAEFSSVESLSPVWLFATLWIAAHQASLSITNSQSLLKLMVMPSNISFSVVPFSSCLQSFPSSESFPRSQFFTSVGQSIGLQHQFFMWNAGLDESRGRIKIVWRNTNKLRYADTTLVAESEQQLKSLLMRVKEESEKAGINLNIQKTKIMASGSIISCQIDGEKVETVADFIFFGSKITADSNCSHKIKRCLLLGRKAMTNLDSLLKNRDIILPTKVSIVKTMVFPVVTYGCESWTIKKAERWKTDAFELWCWRILLRVPWTARRSKQSILKEINSEYSLEGLMLKLKLQSFGHLMWGANSLEKTLMLGKIDGKRRRGQQRMR